MPSNVQTGPTSSTTPTQEVVAVTSHPIYLELGDVWRRLAHVAEGTGGFLDGTYLVAHPREWVDHKAENPTTATKKLKERRTLARYENWADTILTLLAGGLFRKQAVRRAGDDSSETPHAIEDWWLNVDGMDTPIDQWWVQAWKVAAIFGHAIIVMDRDPKPSDTYADAPPLYLRLYTPLDVPDWLVDERGALTGIAVAEAIPRATFTQSVTGTQVRHILPDGWRVVQRSSGTANAGAVVAQGAWDYQGALPVVVLYGKRRALTPVIGQSILGDPQLFIDDYNLTSEIRELLRKQTFSILNVPLGVGPDAVTVEQAQIMLGEVTGTANVAFTPEPASYLSPDTSNVTVYQDERTQLRRTMFRLAGLPWEGDSRDAESADSRRIKREDLNQTLGGYAAEIEVADEAIARLWFQATYGARWEREWEAAGVTITWPDTFDSDVLDDVIARTQAAIGLGLGKTAQKELKKQVVGALLPTATPSTLQEIAKELDAQEEMPSAVDAQRARLQAALAGEPDEDEAEDEDDASESEDEVEDESEVSDGE